MKNHPMVFFNVEIKYLQKFKIPYKIGTVNRFEGWKKIKIIMNAKKREQEMTMGFLFGKLENIKSTGYVAHNRKPRQH